MEMRVERVMAATPDRVLRALTNAGELRRWTGAEPQVDEATYRMTGKTVPGAELGGRLLERSESAVRFEWPLKGETSVVTVTLEAVPQEQMPKTDFTKVKVAHEGIPEGALGDVRYEKECWECIWVLLLRNLRTWVERAEAPGLFEYTSPMSALVERTLIMDAPVERVWRALTDPELRSRWLGIELGAELSREVGRRVVYDWPHDPLSSHVSWTVEPLEGGRTLVCLQHQCAEGLGFDLHLGWHDWLVSLYQETARPLVRQTVWIKAPAERVWRYMASQEGMRRWWNSQMTFEPHVGGKVFFNAHGGDLGGKVTAFEPNKRLAFTWTEYGVGWPEPEPLLLTLTLTEEDGGTRLTLTHSGFENLPEEIRPREFGGYQRGWAPGKMLPAFKQLVEGELEVA